jgi:tripartite ATP-independent transporter DctM subunit
MRIFGIFVQRIWGQMSNWILVALPMFIFMGLMLERSGVTEKLMTNFIQLFGRFRGGLALGVVLIGILLAASTGIVGASVVLLAMLSMPIMLQEGYNKGFASGVVASAGTLGILIPPSIMLIIMADQMSVSVGNLFMGALFPGLMLGGFYLLYILIAAALFRKLAPAPTDLPPVTWG